MKSPKKTARAAAPIGRPRVLFSRPCTRQPTDKECLLSDLGADRDEVACIQVARHFLCTFTVATSQAWMAAFSLAEAHFDYQNGPVIASLIARILDAVRRSRQSCLHYNTPNCDSCCAILTEHERRLLQAVMLVRRARLERADLELMMLCEGNDTAQAMMWIRELALALPQVQTPVKPLVPHQMPSPRLQ